MYFIALTGTESRHAAVWMYPPRSLRAQVNGLENAPQQVRQMYVETLDTFNSQTANRVVLNQARIVLEAIAHDALPETEGDKVWRLMEALEKLPEHVDFAGPILQVAQAIKVAGDKGSHFSPKLNVQQEHRAMILDLLDALVEYMYVIPAQTKAAHRAFVEMAGQEFVEEPEEKVGYAYLPPKLRRALKKQSDKAGISVEDYIRQTLEAAAAANPLPS